MISQYKENAKMSLKGNWGNAIIVFLGIYFLGGFISSIPQYFILPLMPDQTAFMTGTGPTFDMAELIAQFITVFILVLVMSIGIGIFVTGILQLGYARFSIVLAREDKADPDVIFDGFKNHYWINVKAILWVALYSFLWYLPSIFLYSLGGYFAATENQLFVVFLILGAVAALFAVFKIIKYSLVPFLLMDDTVSFETGKEYMKESERIMTGNVLELILLGLSFFFWIFFLIITLGFGILYVGPYIQQSYANFYLQKQDEKNIAYQ